MINLKKTYLLLLLLAFIGFGCTQNKTDKSKIEDACNKFMAGRIALEEKGDSSLLQSVTEDSLFKFIMLNEQYIKLLNAPVSSPDLHIYPQKVEIQGNCATCLMSGMEYYQIHLCRYGNDWKVNGENGRRITPEMFVKVLQQIADQKIFTKERPARDSVFVIVNAFFTTVKQFFKDQRTDSLQQLCSDASVSFIKRLYAYAKIRAGLKPLLEEMEKPNYLSADVKFENDKAVYKFYDEETTILLQRTEHAYIITGFNGTESRYINEVQINQHYTDLLRALKLIRPKQYRDKAFK
ncbi:hypothetical protein [Ferruginibacter sp.]